MPSLIEQLESREKAYILLKHLPFVMPKMNADEIELPEKIMHQAHPDLQWFENKIRILIFYYELTNTSCAEIGITRNTREFKWGG